MALNLPDYMRQKPEADSSSSSGLTLPSYLSRPKPATTPTEPPTTQRPQPSSGLLRRTVGDTAVDLGRGIIGVGEAAVGLANIPTFGYAGKGLEAVGYRPAETKEMIGSLYSPERQEANREVEQAEGFVGTAKAMLRRPSTIAGAVAESAPSILGGGAIARGLSGVRGLAAQAVPRTATAAQTSSIAAQNAARNAARAAIGEGAIGAGGAAEGIRQQTDDGTLSGKQVAAALGTGATTALLGYGGGRLAQRLGIGDVDTVLAGAGRNAIRGPTKTPGLARRTLQGAATEGVLEEMPQSATEQMWQNLALDRPLTEGVPESAAAGMLTGTAIGGPFAALSRPRPTVEPAPDIPDDITGARARALERVTPQQREEMVASDAASAARPEGNLTDTLRQQQEGQLLADIEAAETPEDRAAAEVRLAEFQAQVAAWEALNGNVVDGGAAPVAPAGPGIKAAGEAVPGGDPQRNLGDDAGAQGFVAGVQTDLAGAGSAADTQPALSPGQLFPRAAPRLPDGSPVPDPASGPLSRAVNEGVASGAVPTTQQAPMAEPMPEPVAEQPGPSADTGLMPGVRMEPLGEKGLLVHGDVAAIRERLAEAGFRKKGSNQNGALRFSAKDRDELEAALAQDAVPQPASQSGLLAPPARGEMMAAESPGDVAWQTPVTMQNRDRSRVASVGQMHSIRNSPDPERLGFSRDPNTGAPMVGEGRAIPDADKGASDVVIGSDGRRVPVRYAVVEAGDLVASHDVDGRANPEYASAPLKALNNGRVAGIQAAWKHGNGDAYKAGLIADARMHGVSPEAIQGKQNPVLVRLYDPAENRNDMGAWSNTGAQLEMSPVERAQTDARALPPLEAIEWAEDGSLPPAANANFFRAWFKNMGEAQAAGLQDAQGRPNAAALQRVRAALVQRAYGDERLLTALAEEVNPDHRNVMHALVRAAPAFAALDQNDAVAQDIRARVTEALEVLRQAVQRGVPLEAALAQIDMLGRAPEADAIAGFLGRNARSVRRMADAIRAMAIYASDAQSQAATTDIFGNASVSSVRGAIEAANHALREEHGEQYRIELPAEHNTGTAEPRDRNGERAAGGRSAVEEAGRTGAVLEGEGSARQGQPGILTLSAPASTPAASTTPAPAQVGLFAPPTRREELDAEIARRDAVRNGQTATGRTDMMAGDGELFAGPRPEQADIEQQGDGLTVTIPYRDGDRQVKAREVDGLLVFLNGDAWDVLRPAEEGTYRPRMIRGESPEDAVARAKRQDETAAEVRSRADDARKGTRADQVLHALEDHPERALSMLSDDEVLQVAKAIGRRQGRKQSVSALRERMSEGPRAETIAALRPAIEQVVSGASLSGINSPDPRKSSRDGVMLAKATKATKQQIAEREESTTGTLDGQMEAAPAEVLHTAAMGAIQVGDGDLSAASRRASRDWLAKLRSAVNQARSATDMADEARYNLLTSSGDLIAGVLRDEAAYGKAEIDRAIKSIRGYAKQAGIESMTDALAAPKPAHSADRVEGNKKAVSIPRETVEPASTDPETGNVGLFSRPDTASRDAEYRDAVERGDMESAQRMVNEAAEQAGYQADSDHRMSHRAPNSEDDVSLADVRTSGLVPDDYWTHPQWYTTDPRERAAMSELQALFRRMDAREASGRAPGGASITVYRAVPKSVKEGAIRNGDWVSPSENYARDEGASIPGGYRIISQRVSAKNLWWDGNSAAELGYDDGKGYAYRNTKNNRKLLDAVTRDDDGNVIPLSRRFQARNSDARFSHPGQPGPRFLTSAADVQAAVRQVLDTWKGDKPVVRVVQTADDLPAAAKQAEGWKQAEGYWDGGSTVYIVAGNNRDVARALEVLSHEAIGHYGIERIMEGKDWARLVADVKRLRGLKQSDVSPKIWQVLQSAKRRYGQENDTVFAKEFLAIMSEQGVRSGLTSRVAAAIRQFLAKLGIPVNIGKTFREAELLAALHAGRQRVTQGERGARQPSGRQPARAMAFSQSTPTFYSAMLESVAVAKGLPRAGATAAQWKGWLDGAIRRGEFKQSERDWLGVDSWLAGRGKVTPQELAEFIRANEVQVEDVVLGDDGAVAAEVEAWWNDEGGANEETPYGELSPSEQREARERYMDEVAEYAEGGPATKFAQYQLPGGENYRELLLTLPARNGRTVEQERRLQYLIEEYGHDLSLLGDDLRSEIESIQSLPDLPNFQSGHYDQPNILAHVRFNERVDSDGKRVLFIEEIQSDWHQDGRKKGYGPKLIDGKGHAYWRQRALDLRGGDPEAYQEAAANRDALQGRNAGVPEAPFKQTDEWAMLAFKRMVRHAAENGFDRIAWTTGEQQAKRYDLSKQVRELNAVKNGDFYYLTATSARDGGTLDELNNEAFTAEQLPDVVGKDLAEKIVTDGGGIYSGGDLRVGGEGMRAFYDNILPKAVNKWAKKFGAKVGYTDINAADAPRVHAIDVTPAMRDAALSGLPMFSRPDSTARNGVEYAHGQEALTSWLASWSSALRLGGSRPRPVESRPEAVGQVARNESGAAEQGDASREEIREQSQRLIERAKAEGFFWGDDSPILAELDNAPAYGGAEHRVYIIGEGDSRFVIRATDNGFFGPRSDISPAQYLARLDDYSSTFPSLQTRLIGVSESAEVEGNAVIWTAQPYVRGTTFRNQPALADAMRAHGWEQVGDDQSFQFRHKETGAIIEDAHTDNVLQDDNGDLYPFDVVMEALPNSGRFSRPDPNPETPASAGVSAFSGKENAILDGIQSAIRNPGRTTLDAIKNKVEQWRPAWLGALTLRHLAELGEKYLPQIKQYADVVQQIATDRNVMQEEGGELAGRWQTWAKKNRAQNNALVSMMHDATISGVDPAEAYADLPIIYGGRTVEANRKNVRETLLAIREQMRGRSGDSKREMQAKAKEVKGLIARNRRRRNQHAVLTARWQALSPEAQAMYREVRDMYVKRRDQREAALIQRIRDMKMDGARTQSVINSIRQQFESARVQAPYFPLQRFGEFWISAASPTGEPTYIMRESYKEWQKELRELKAAGFTIKASGRKGETSRSLEGASAAFVTDVIKKLQAAGAPDSVRDEIYQLYLQSLPDLSQRKHSIHRKAVAGYSQDAIRAFGTNALHDAHQIARMKYSHQLAGLMDVMAGHNDGRRQAPDVDQTEVAAADALLSEMKKRHEWIMNPQDAKLTNLISSIGFVYYLGLTPAAALVNLSQTAITTFPALAANPKVGPVKAMNLLLAGMRDSIRTGGNLQRTLTNPEEQRAYQALRAMGAIDKTLAHNLAGIAEGDSAKFSPVWAKTMNGISLMFHKAEVVNREATGIAAYRAARGEGKSFDEAVKYASEMIWQTHLDYSNANRARFMQGNVAKTLLMFRQYSLGMTWFLARNFWQTFKGESKEVRRQAFKTLAGTLGMTAVFSGTLGLPVLGMVFSILNAAAASFGDDDEPWDAETEFRNFLADHLGADAARVVTDGPVNALTGADIASRVSLNGLWFRDADRELEGRDAFHNYLEQIAGPVGGIGKNLLVGKALMDEGHLFRGVETMLPKALKDGFKGFRYATEGVNNLRGDAVVDDLNAWQTLLQVNGFTPSEVSEQYEANRASKNYEQAILGRRARLMDAFAMATRLNDTEARTEVLEKIRTFNKANPELPITGDTIRRSIRDRLRYSARAEGGIVLDRRLARRARDQARFNDGEGGE